MRWSLHSQSPQLLPQCHLARVACIVIAFLRLLDSLLKRQFGVLPCIILGFLRRIVRLCDGISIMFCQLIAQGKQFFVCLFNLIEQFCPLFLICRTWVLIVLCVRRQSACFCIFIAILYAVFIICIRIFVLILRAVRVICICIFAFILCAVRSIRIGSRICISIPSVFSVPF